MDSSEIVAVSPVIPVVVIDDAAEAVSLARALVAGGVRIVELTLRTSAALDAIRAIAAEVPEILLGAGTVLRPEDAEDAVDAGARFLVSPGATPRILDALEASGVPAIPGVATVSESLAAWERGHVVQKLFPAVASGGVPLLRSLAGPLPQVRFCPTGGVTAANAPEFLALPNVVCVGGSWLTPAAEVDGGDWGAVARLAAEAAALL
ncbi:bifunctional 4-hydroxy-2-oxoglutarate aldolase/2-dehydro-3-deoxy-phosphogluconate aldolase [Microbacterium sp. 18062]|uniref:bifunctional 4-hydroxy-2-oxoglutarate aldolase/2-dehydro-3-deoxy-phosphogluconate aldolase n=1 Tax=Microbacterium sp. 18062 TaxID=2681410 RepID=UPI00135CE338|nr:bifunctional 4-hydroxy-2-oxoglutarate aldolase/2-dehydro-3-deoxy-phosphogluconate aldolase [Microbacterium sp. 18062]